jgi:phage terminase large subunit
MLSDFRFNATTKGFKLNPALRSTWSKPSDVKVIYGGRASSKCLGLGTQVMMFNGTLKAVENIRVGDLVMGPDSLPRKVLDTTRGKSQLYLVHQSTAMDYIVNDEHILSLKRTKSSYKSKPLANVEGYSIRYPEYGDVANISIKEYMARSNKFKTNFLGYKAGLISFEEQEIKIDPYYLGLWLGDGDRDNAIITTMDEEIIDYMESFSISQNMKMYFVGNNGSKASKYRIAEYQKGGKNRILTALNEYGILTYFTRKDKKVIRNKVDKRIPKEYINNSEDIRLKLLAGLIDTDGTYLKKRASMVIVSSCENMAKDIKLLVDTLGFKSSILKRTTTAQNNFVGTAWSITFSGNLNRIPTLLPRKKAIENKINCKNHLTTYTTVSDYGYGEYAGFSVNGDHLFCLADGTVTHNSHDAAGHAIYLAQRFTLRFLCARQFQNRISESVYTLLCEKIAVSGFKSEFIITKNSIKHRYTGSEFIFYGIARNLSEIKSAEGIDVLWLEEANYLTEIQWTTIEPTIRANHSEIWIIFNPGNITDFAYQRFVVNPPKGAIVRKINWDENPFLSPKMVRVIKAAYAENKEQADHIYGGEPMTGADKSVINLKFILAAKDAHLKIPEWPKDSVRRSGYDVADDGEDLNAIVDFIDNIICHVEEWKGLEDQLNKSAHRVYNHAMQNNTTVTYDATGLGRNMGSNFKDFNAVNKEKNIPFKLIYDAFNAGAGVHHPDKVFLKLPHLNVTNKEYFENVKAQGWVEVGERFRKTYERVELGIMHPIEELISIDTSKVKEPYLTKMCFELSTPLKDTSNNGKFMVETKKDLKKRDIKSPNIADAAIMAVMKPVRKAMGFFD